MSKNDAIQTVRGHLDKLKARLEDILKQKSYVHTGTLIKPTQKMEHERRMATKKLNT